MSIFSSSIVNVAQAIAPFEKVRDNLKEVLSVQSGRKAAATQRLDRAKAALEESKKIEGGLITEAQQETLRAQALLEKLNILLATDQEVDLDKMSASEKATAGHKLGE
jgi:hypothetical protein